MVFLPNDSKRVKELEEQVKKLQQELATFNFTKEARKELILKELKKRKRLLTIDVIQIGKFKSYDTARLWMLKLAMEFPEMVNHAKGGWRGSSILFWNGEMSFTDKVKFLAEQFDAEGRVVYLKTAKTLCRIDSDEELQKIIRALPSYISLVRTKDRDRWHLWRRY